MFNDSVQGMEYTITTPLLFATLLAAICPEVPTSMVQWTYGCLTASHLLTIPVLYLSHVYVQQKNRKDLKEAKDANGNAVYIPWMILKLAILSLLISCAMLQAAGLIIGAMHMYGSYMYYDNFGDMQAVAGGLVAMQFFFVLAVILSTGTDVLFVPAENDRGCGSCTCKPHTVTRIICWIYVFINMFMKLIIASVLASNARNKYLPVLSCRTWDGNYQSLEEYGMPPTTR